jgi:threonine/homoserine efflux transporter RhtA
VSGLFAVAQNRVPLAYEPALHNWPLVLPLALWFGGTLVLALRIAQRRATRDLVLAVGLAIGTSLLVNDSATYELVGGVAALAALVRFSPAVAPLTVPALARMPLPAQALPNEATRD